MKNAIHFFKSPLLLFVMVFSIIACDDEFSETESDVLNQDNVNFYTDKIESPVIAYNKKLEALQVNNLNSYLLGFYKDPAFGTTTASLITQITPAAFSPNFGENPVIDAVILKIPYYSRVIGTNSEGNPTYTINDSLYGEEFQQIDAIPTPKPFKLSIHETTYFLRDFDPFTNDSQKYYSNATSTQNSVLNGNTTINFDNYLGQSFIEETVTPSSDAKSIIDFDNSGTQISKRVAPALYYELDHAFWKTKIIDKQNGAPELSNANNFRNYIRGLYFKAESITNDGSMVMLNTNTTDANITIYYKHGAEGSRRQSSYVLLFTGQKINAFINDYSPITLEDGDGFNGDDKLYLKGTEGSMAVVNLFESQTALDEFKERFRESDGKGGYKLSKLINDVQLIAYEHPLITNKDLHKYDRIFAYDITNNTPTFDYSFDSFLNLQSPFNSKTLSLGQRIKESEGVYKYKIRLTEHIKNIILNDLDLEDTKIGLALSTNVNYITSADMLNSATSVPAAAVITTRGTILYGNLADDATKKMKLHVFFTEPK